MQQWKRSKLQLPKQPLSIPFSALSRLTASAALKPQARAVFTLLKDAVMPSRLA